VVCEEIRREGQFMSIESVRGFFAARAPDVAVMEAAGSTATVALAAAAYGVAPAQIAKTLSLRVGEAVFLLEALTGHPVGGVCPFGLLRPLPVFCDVSLKAFDEVLPAAGAANSAVRISPLRLAELVGAAWVDVCENESTSG
jgi:prolyl-tRNA editing enzyme YbaK/EbsC (Cys-tRNA(Pro) deacylase)